MTILLASSAGIAARIATPALLTPSGRLAPSPDRLIVRLSDAAAQAREEALKKASKKKGGDA